MFGGVACTAQGAGVSLKTGDPRFQFHADLKQMAVIIRTEGRQGSGLKAVTKSAPEVSKSYQHAMAIALVGTNSRCLVVSSGDGALSTSACFTLSAK